MIRIFDPDAGWPAAFELEARRLRSVLGAAARRIDHVGSTSVPGLAAKPVIDIQVSVSSLQPANEWIDAMGRLGYSHMVVEGLDDHYPFFRRPGDWPSTHHVHLCQLGGEQERRHLLFRDWLRHHPADVAAYASLKRALAAEHGGHTQAQRACYALAKTTFIEDVLARADAAGPPAAWGGVAAA